MKDVSVIETERLVLRPIKARDTRDLYAIASDREHMAFTTCHADLPTSERHFSMLQQQWSQNGYGAWTIIEKLTGQIIGWGGIILDEDEPGWGPELVYFLHPQASGKGYAQEMAWATLRFAFQECGLSELGAFAMRENERSQHLLTKLGFRRVEFVEALNRDYFVRKADQGC